MNGRCIFFMVIIVLVVLRYLKKDYHTGLAICVGLLVSMPDYLRISIGGGIPEMTIHRVLLIVLLMFWWPRRKQFLAETKLPFKPMLLTLLVAQFLSFVFSIEHKLSMKSFFVFSVEIVLFFTIISTSLNSRQAIVKVLYAVAIGLGFVALIAGYEKRFEYNWSEELILGYEDNPDDVTSTYPHRIVLGYAMAMAVPVLLAVKDLEQRPRWKKFLWVMLLLTLAGCYFGNSRGPWSGLFFGTAPLVIFGSKDTKKMLVYMVALGLLVIALRPGVRETLGNLWYATFVEKDSIKSYSYQYRWKLWSVAFSEIKKSPEKLLFGYGGLTTETMDLSDYFDKSTGEGSTVLLGHTSWDNQLACDLIEFGLVGFIAEAYLLFSVMKGIIVLWRRLQGPDKNFLLSIISSSAIYIYALSNVYIFSPQLKCLFWALAACGIRYGQLAWQEKNTPVLQKSPAAAFPSATAPRPA